MFIGHSLQEDNIYIFALDTRIFTIQKVMQGKSPLKPNKKEKEKNQ